MAHHAFLAYEDALTAPTTVRYINPRIQYSSETGRPNMGSDGWLSDDLGEMTFFPHGVTQVAFYFGRRVPVGVIGMLGLRIAELIPSSGTGIGHVSVFGFLDNTIVLNLFAQASISPSSPLDLDHLFAMSADVIVERLIVEISIIDNRRRGACIGRLFVGPCLRFTGVTPDTGALDPGWRMALTDPTKVPIGVAGAARPQPVVTGRRLSFTLSGLTDAQADSLAIMQQAVGTSKPVLAMLRGNSTNTTARNRYAAFGPLVEPLNINKAAGGVTWTASVVVQEAQR